MERDRVGGLDHHPSLAGGVLVPIHLFLVDLGVEVSLRRRRRVSTRLCSFGEYKWRRETTDDQTEIRACAVSLTSLLSPDDSGHPVATGNLVADGQMGIQKATPSATHRPHTRQNNHFCASGKKLTRQTLVMKVDRGMPRSKPGRPGSDGKIEEVDLFSSWPEVGKW